jgi:hypothetical protein
MTLIVKKDGIYNQLGEKQKLEFGNTQQIEALRKAEKELNKHTEGFEVEVDYEVEILATVNFKCVCGTNLHIKKNVGSEDATDAFDSDSKTCYKCQRVYELSDEEDGLMCKLKK